MKVLVANRGEIACRIIRTLQEMSIDSVAIYSHEDRQSPQVWLANEAIDLRKPDCYLDGTAIVQAAKRMQATAIHPGYGFLAENPDFALQCQQADLLFIGPNADTIATAADKLHSKELVKRLAIPVVPGQEVSSTAGHAEKAAQNLGYPVLLKARGGGGGKGIRLVCNASEMEEHLLSVEREAKLAFRDARLIIEKWIHPARHIEVNFIGDGNTVATLGERECSLQRRHQKLVEETPSPGVDNTLREKLQKATRKIAHALQYNGIGTVEFLVGHDQQFYFLELNCRLQVEHPVTEMCTGMDLVRTQIEMAQGSPLPEGMNFRGHAIEVRLNAEDVYEGFVPSDGTIQMLEWPTRPHVRIDTGMVVNSTVSSYYDSLLAKLIAYGENREQARRRLVEALYETTVLGVHSNQRFLIAVLGSDFFRKGQTFTTTIEDRSWSCPDYPNFVEGAVARFQQKNDQAWHSNTKHVKTCPWQILKGFRITPPFVRGIAD